MPETKIGYICIVAMLMLYVLLCELPNIKTWWSDRKARQARNEAEYRTIRYIFSSLVLALRFPGKPGLVDVSDDGTGWKGAKVFIPKTAANFGYKAVYLRDDSSGSEDGKEQRFDFATFEPTGLFIAEVAVNLDVENARRVRLSCILRGVQYFKAEELDKAILIARAAFAQVNFEKEKR
jgi:hypothetical protein